MLVGRPDGDESGWIQTGADIRLLYASTRIGANHFLFHSVASRHLVVLSVLNIDTFSEKNWGDTKRRLRNDERWFGERQKRMNQPVQWLVSYIHSTQSARRRSASRNRWNRRGKEKERDDPQRVYCSRVAGKWTNHADSALMKQVSSRRPRQAL